MFVFRADSDFPLEILLNYDFCAIDQLELRNSVHLRTILTLNKNVIEHLGVERSSIPNQYNYECRAYNLVLEGGVALHGNVPSTSQPLYHSKQVT